MEKCYSCGNELRGIYEVLIFNGETYEKVKCCSKDCSEDEKDKNIGFIHGIMNTIAEQIVNIQKEEDFTHEEKIKRFIKRNGYTYTVEDILDGYKRFLNHEYVSYSMEKCISELSISLQVISLGGK